MAVSNVCRLQLVVAIEFDGVKTSPIARNARIHELAIWPRRFPIDYGSGSIAILNTLCGQLPQHVMQDPAVLVILPLLRRVDTNANLKLDGRAVDGRGNYGNFLRTRFQPFYIEGLGADEC